MNLTLSTCFAQVHDPDLPDVAIVLTNYVNGGPDDSDANLVRIDQPPAA